jgi:hypothetical protein
MTYYCGTLIVIILSYDLCVHLLSTFFSIAEQVNTDSNSQDITISAVTTSKRDTHLQRLLTPGVIPLRGTSFKSDIHPPPSMQHIPSADKTRTHFQYNPCKPRDRSKTTRRNRHLGYERAGLSGANCRRVVDTIPALSQVTFRHHDVCIVKAPLHLTGQYIHVNTRAGVARSVGMMGKVRVD